MRFSGYIISFLILILAGSCVTKFIPDVREAGELLVVEGVITDQPGANTVMLSKSVPLDQRNTVKPLSGCIVTIADNEGNIFSMTETVKGTYISNPSEFQGVVGRKYQLRITVHDATLSDRSYESVPEELRAVPPIDSLYFRKVTLRMRPSDMVPMEEGCQIYLDTHDPTGKCSFYRWTFTETWEILLPYPTEKHICWTSENSNTIKIKTTSTIAEDRVSGFPLHFISNETDRLETKYSILAKQYSMSSDEFDYWSKLQSISEETGSLYDIIPASVNGNIYNIDDPYEQVLGYFSVSAVSEKRIFIEEPFAGQVNLYNKCVTDTSYLRDVDSIPGINQNIWLLLEYDYAMPPYKLLSRNRRCADCTTRGTTVEPAFWRDDEDLKAINER
jgi:hypothetical protein